MKQAIKLIGHSKAALSPKEWDLKNRNRFLRLKYSLGGTYLPLKKTPVLIEILVKQRAHKNGYLSLFCV